MEELKLDNHVWYEGGAGTLQWMGWTTEDQIEPIILIKKQDAESQYAFDQDLDAVYLSDVQVVRGIPVYPLRLNQHLRHPLTEKDIKGRVRRDGRVGLSYESNSCYLDVTLMSMFAFSDAFDDLIPQVPVLFPELQDPPSYIRLRVQAALKEIVHQIRCKHLVGPEPVRALRKLLSTHQQEANIHLDERWEDSENDPPTLISFLVSNILETSLTRVWEHVRRGKRKPKRSIMSSRDVIFTFIPGQGTPLMTYQQFFEEGMRYDNCSLDTFPKRLVIQLPGHQGPDATFSWPSFVLDITDKIHQGPHQCQVCGMLAQVQCQACYNLLTENEASTYYCRRCSDRVHKMMKPVLEASHSVQMLSADQLGDWPAGSVPPRTIMRLRSILCICHHHYTGFLRVDNANPSHPHHWVYYNDMGPQMTEVEMENILTSRFKSHLIENGRRPLPGHQTQLVKNAYVLFYDSPQKTYF